MTIDERLEKLVERHEALTQTVELIAQMQQKTEREVGELARSTRRLQQWALLYAADFHTRLQRLEDELDRGQNPPAKP